MKLKIRRKKIKINKCECGKHQAFYLLDSWFEGDSPRKLCIVCADKMIMKLGQPIMKDVLNLREITNESL